jgi:hypothetical protein
MNGIYAPAPFQLRRPSRVVYGHCFDRALYRGFERHLTPGIEWDEKRGRHATAAFERGAWDIALSHCLERSADAGTTISNLFDFDRARRFHLPAERAPDILDCDNWAIDLSLREIATDLSRRSTRQPCANCGSHPPLVITRSVVPLVPKRSEHGAPLLCEREPRPKIVFDETFIATALTVSTVMPAFAHSVPVTMLRPETPAYLSKYRKYRAIRQFHLDFNDYFEELAKIPPARSPSVPRP